MTPRKAQKDLGFDPNRLRRIDAWMQDHVDAGRLAGLSVQISRHGQIAYSQHCGLRDISQQAPVTADTIWRIYSMTKPITTIAALMLYEKGAFQLDQPVADFLPGFGRAGVWRGPGHGLEETDPLERPVTIHDLMTHQSGLVYGDPDGDALEQACHREGMDFDWPNDTLQRAVARLAGLPLRFQPGKRWFYGLSTDVLGFLVEVLSGQPLSRVFQTQIFDPLAMVDTRFDVPEAQKPRLAALYEPGLTDVSTTYDAASPVTLESGGGGLVSTLGDYQRFCDMLLARGAYAGGHLLGRKTFDMMVSNQMGGDLAACGQAHFSETTFHGIGFGLGVSVMLDPAQAQILGSPGEFAWGGMASTAFWVDPAEDMTVVLMTQLTPSSHYTLRRQLRVLSYQALVG